MIRAAALLPLALLAGTAIASAVPDSTVAPCSAPEYRQFDFWVGDWEVRNPKGDLVGTNVVSRRFGDCVIQEHWNGKRGLEGSSFNIYDPAARKWHQTWVDSQGTLLLLSGEFRDGTMTLAGESPSGAGGGKIALQRITWQPQADGRVRQLWESSGDAGKTWSVVFDGMYSRKR